MAQAIREKLEAAFKPEELIVEDDSVKHAGHSGARAGGETHFSVRIVSSVFESVPRVERQRRVYAALSAEFESNSIHALALTTLTPAEVWQEH